jgi:tetratricopeptide (TPR) repeat protein
VVVASWQAWNIAEADFIYNRASYYRMSEMWDASLQDFVAAAKLVPWEVKYAVYSGLAYEEKAKVTADPEAQKRYLGDAIVAYQRGVRMNPTNAYYLGNLGRAYGLAAELDRTRPELYTQAVDYYRQAIAQGSVTVLFYQNLGVLYLSHGDEKGFEEVQAKLGEFDPVESARLDFTAANQFYAQGDLVRADRYYGLALGHNPKYIEALFNLGIVRVQRFGPAQALPLWRQVLEINPAFEPAQQMLQRYATPGGRANAGDILIPRR